MSADEDNELRDLVAQTLETNGTLGKIRAQLRASVFLALEEQEPVQNKTPFLNKKLKDFLNTKEGKVVASLVRDFLQCFDLEFTLAVFDPETGLGQDYDHREALVKELNITDSGNADQSPLLAQVVKIACDHKSTLAKAVLSETHDSHEPSDYITVPKNLTEAQIIDAQIKFEQYDKDGSGTIDKEELRDLFMDIFPGFHRNMLDRYVNDEFKAVDKDFSNSIDFNEFLGMYKRLFLLCKSVVSQDVSGLLQSSSHSGKPPPLPSTPPPPMRSVEIKNKINMDDMKNGSGKDDLDGLKNDSFFDDPVPPVGGLRSFNSTSTSRSKPSHIPVYSPLKSSEANKQAESKALSSSGVTTKKVDYGPVNSVGGSDMTSLQGLPSLNKDKGSSMSSLMGAPPLDTDRQAKRPNDSGDQLRDSGPRLNDFGNDHSEIYEYEDDYEPDDEANLQSSGISVSQKSNRSDKKSTQENGSLAEDTEEIEEDITADDFPNSEKNGFDDLQTDDVSLSQADGIFDYQEEALP
ncbi:centrosomal protein 43-like isoform X2 [Gigantopelta aegis]|uniref:centrosomal protein 43-like isoform X2 n=1 Tax=Gigantopelta aegis TaxID=1735272 RepID=UPI001B888DCC|nr:centrosomal protein 43-like isoform X2 [Gigantopelta aegis]